MAIGKKVKERFFEDIKVLKEFEWLADNYFVLLEEKGIDIGNYRDILTRRAINDLKLLNDERRRIKYGTNNFGECVSCKGPIPSQRHHKAKTCSQECSQKLQITSLFQMVEKNKLDKYGK